MSENQRFSNFFRDIENGTLLIYYFQYSAIINACNKRRAFRRKVLKWNAACYIRSYTLMQIYFSERYYRG